MRSIAESGGFCAFHASRIAEIGQSATVALIYLSLIEYCLPRFAARRAPRGGPFPVFPALDACAACAHQQEVERRECFFLALLIQTHGSRCYGAPALVCLRHLPPLLEYLDERSIGDILARHLGVAAALKPENTADTIMRLLLGPARPARDPPAPLRGLWLYRYSRSRSPDAPSPARPALLSGLRRNHGCPHRVARLAGKRVREGTQGVGCVAAVPRPRLSGAYRRRPGAGAGARRGRPGRGRTAPRICSRFRGLACRGSRRLLDRIGGAFGAASGRRAALASLRRGRECPLCVRAREAGERALSLIAVLVESAGGRRTFESGYGLCVRHAAQAMAMPDASVFGDIVADTTHARLALLRWELEEQMRRGAWQARPQRRGVESAAWLRAGVRFAGTI